MEQRMDIFQTTLLELTGAINRQIETIKEIDRRVSSLESPHPTPAVTSTEVPLKAPQTEDELKQIEKLPDCVKELQPFDGNPVHYLSWVHNVETILKDYELVRHKPIYRAILQSIRQKIRGQADNALISYNIFCDSWSSIKKCLSLHYADKRDVRTLEHQLNLLTQGNMTVDEFYANVNHQFSLLVNKIKTEDYSRETTTVLIESYRNRALDVFIRGLNGELSKMLIIQKPQTLPEAYASCLEIQNLNFRNISIKKNNSNNFITAPINQFFPRNHIGPPKPAPRAAPRALSINRRNEAYNIQHESQALSPPRPSQPKPPTPMEIDESIQTKRVNYMNRPLPDPNTPQKRILSSDNYPHKQQRMYSLQTGQESSNKNYSEVCQEEIGEEDFASESEEDFQANFMTAASLAFHT